MTHPHMVIIYDEKYLKVYVEDILMYINISIYK